MNTIDLDNRDNCPLGDQCEGCATTEDLAVSTAETDVGIYCLTLCAACEEEQPPPLRSWRVATERVLTHAEHLGIDAEVAAAIRNRQHDGGDGR